MTLDHTELTHTKRVKYQNKKARAKKLILFKKKLETLTNKKEDK